MNSRGFARIISATAVAAVLMGAAAPIPCDFYDRGGFSKSVQSAVEYDTPGELLAGVVPHHLLAGEKIASFFKTAAQYEYDTVVFVAPSHYPTYDKVITATGGWQTPFGLLQNDEGLTAALLKNGVIGAAADEDNMRLDHAVAGLAPYVKYYMPDAMVAQVLLQNALGGERVEALAQELYSFSKTRRLLVVASVDFSHYLMPDEAARRDRQTRAAIEAADFPRIAAMDDKNIDSPQAITTFLRYAQLCGAEETAFLDHTSSDKILMLPPGDPAYSEGTTTYFILAATRG